MEENRDYVFPNPLLNQKELDSLDILTEKYNRNLLRYYPLLSASNRCYFNGFQSGQKWIKVWKCR